MKANLASALAILVLTTTVSQGALPDLIFTFEQGEDPKLLLDSGERHAIRSTAEASRSKEASKFGQNGLLINRSEKASNDEGTGWEVMLKTQGMESFEGETRQMTISSWIRPVAPVRFLIFRRIPISNLARGFFQFTYLGGEKGRLYFSMAGEGENDKASSFQVMSSDTANVPPGGWTHLAMTFSEGEIRFYANGAPIGKTIFIEARVIPNVLHELSSIKAFSGVAGGSAVDDFGFFGNRALNDDEIAAIYRDGLQAFTEKTNTEKTK